MKLSEYLTAKEIKPTVFAAELGVAPSTITRIVKGERFPGFDLVMRIKKATKGKVAERDWSEAREGAPA